MGNALGAGLPFWYAHAPMRAAVLLSALLLAVLPFTMPARAQTVLDAIRADQWEQADALAAAAPDPLVRKLVLYYRLLSPGGGRAAEGR